jgi:hypothetical protein
LARPVRPRPRQSMDQGDLQVAVQEVMTGLR